MQDHDWSTHPGMRQVLVLRSTRIVRRLLCMTRSAAGQAQEQAPAVPSLREGMEQPDEAKPNAKATASRVGPARKNQPCRGRRHMSPAKCNVPEDDAPWLDPWRAARIFSRGVNRVEGFTAGYVNHEIRDGQGALPLVPSVMVDPVRERPKAQKPPKPSPESPMPRPRLKRLGKLKEITRGQFGNRPDGNSGMSKP